MRTIKNIIGNSNALTMDPSESNIFGGGDLYNNSAKNYAALVTMYNA